MNGMPWGNTGDNRQRSVRRVMTSILKGVEIRVEQCQRCRIKKTVDEEVGVDGVQCVKDAEDTDADDLLVAYNENEFIVQRGKHSFFEVMVRGG